MLQEIKTLVQTLNEQRDAYYNTEKNICLIKKCSKREVSLWQNRMNTVLI